MRGEKYAGGDDIKTKVKRKIKRQRKKTPQSAASIWAALGIGFMLLLVLIPSINGFRRDHAVSRANQQAQLVYSAGAYALTQYTKENGTYLSKNAATGILPAASASQVYLQTGVHLDLSALFPEDFDGYFAFVTNNAGTGIEYALWSQEPFDGITPPLALEGSAVVARYPPDEASGGSNLQ